MHVITGLNVGGAETMLAKLIEARVTATSSVVTMLPPGPVAARIAAAGVPVISLGMRSGMAAPAAALRLIGAARTRRPALVQGWMYHGNLAASFAAHAQRPSPALVWNIRHSLADIRNEKPLSRAVVRLGARLSRGPAAIVYNSRAAARQHGAIGYAGDRAIVIPNGFDCSRFRPSPHAGARLRQAFGIDAAAIVVGMVARQHPMKDAAMLARAVTAARAAGHDLHLLVVGHGMDRPDAGFAGALTALPASRVTLSGARSDVADWLPGLDILAMPSAWGEGFPNILGEAMACGVPCAATDVGDSGWIVGATGEVVAPRDTAAMAAALGRLTSVGPEARRTLGAAARERVVGSFAIDAVAAQYATLYDRVLDEHRSAPHREVRPIGAVADELPR